MADDDQTTLDEEQRSFLLTGVEEFEDADLSFSAASGVDAGNFARSVVGTIGFTLAAAATLFVQGVTEAWTGLIDGVADFLGGTRELVTGVASNLAPGPVYRDVPGLIGTISEGATTAISETWTSALPDSGIAAWLFALGLVLVTFYAAARGFDAITEVLRG